MSQIAFVRSIRDDVILSVDIKLSADYINARLTTLGRNFCTRKSDVADTSKKKKKKNLPKL